MNLEFIQPQKLVFLLMKSSQSNFNLRSPSSYLARSYLIATVSKCMVLFSVWPLCARFCFLLLLLLLLDPLLYLVKRWKKFCKTYHLKDKEREREYVCVCELKFRYSEKAKNGTKPFWCSIWYIPCSVNDFAIFFGSQNFFVAFSENLNFKKLSLSSNKTENSICVPILKPLNHINRKLYHKA